MHDTHNRVNLVMVKYMLIKNAYWLFHTILCTIFSVAEDEDFSVLLRALEGIPPLN